MDSSSANEAQGGILPRRQLHHLWRQGGIAHHLPELWLRVFQPMRGRARRGQSMSVARIPFDPVLGEYVTEQAIRLARKHGIYLADIFSKRQHTGARKARAEFYRLLWETVEYKRASRAWTFRASTPPRRTRAVELGPGWAPISYPMIGRLLNVDHSAIVGAFAKQRREKKNDRDGIAGTACANAE